MKKGIYFILTLSFLTFTISCEKENLAPATENQINHNPQFATVYTGFPETIESGSKTTYTAADVTLSTGVWNFNNALIGTSTSDRKYGAKAARIQTTGMLTMQFDVTNGASMITIYHAVYGTDASSTWDLYASTNQGTTWAKIGSTVTTSSTTINSVPFGVSYTGNVRFQIRKLGGGRLNIDNITIEEAPAIPTRDNNLAMGNPSNATTDVNFPNNYLMVKTQYVLSYNNSKGEANWASWHLSAAWKGNAARCNCFASDNTLPSSFYHAISSNYTNSGFDRGHLCPSEDRDGSDADNQATFLMTNMTPQAPNMNEQTWAALETYCRTLMSQGNELYIIAGGYGSGGTGSNGGTTTTIASGHITVPSHFWKVILVLPVGNNDVTRVTTSTRLIAVDMPNVQTVNSHTWDYYKVSVDNIETKTGYNFFSNVPVNVQNVIEAIVDPNPI